MGMPLPISPTLTLEEFLLWENEQPERHEFHRGEVFAMVGARRVHGLVVRNLTVALFHALKGSPCEVFAEGMKVKPADDTILYPDLFVTCDAADLRTEMIFSAPMLVIEVLSPSTQAYDRSHKFALYRQLASFKEYTLVDPDTRRVEAFRLQPNGDWTFHDLSGSEHLTFASIGCEVPLAEVFGGIDTPDPA